MEFVRFENDSERIDSTINMLQTHVSHVDLSGVIAALEAMKESKDQASVARLREAFNQLVGIDQGAVLTYAPMIVGLLSDDPFDKENLAED